MPENGYLYNEALFDIVKQVMNVETLTTKLLLVNPTYTFNAEHRFRNEITGEVVNDTGTGYEHKTVALTWSRTAGVITIDCPNVLYTAIKTTTDIRAGVFFEDTGNPATDRLLVYNQGLQLVTNGSDVELRIPPEGIFQFTNQLA